MADIRFLAVGAVADIRYFGGQLTTETRCFAAGEVAAADTPYFAAEVRPELIRQSAAAEVE